MKWKVRRARNGDWWAHHPECRKLGYLICVLFADCQNCGRFEAAYGYAYYKATETKRLNLASWGIDPKLIPALRGPLDR